MSALRIIALALVVQLAGCSQSAVRNGTDPLAFLAPGSEIQLTRDLDVPAGNTRIFFQRGKAISKSELDFYHTSCDLEVRELQQETQRVSSDLFVVGRLRTGIESVVTRGLLQFADSNLSLRIFGDGGPSIHRYLRVDMHSTLQPNVMRLTCRGAWADYFEARLPGEVEIKLALGDILVFL